MLVICFVILIKKDFLKMNKFKIVKKKRKHLYYYFIIYFLLSFSILFFGYDLSFSKHFSTFGNYEKTNINFCLEAREKGTIYDEEVFNQGFSYRIIYINFNFNFYKLRIDEEISSDSGPLMECKILIDY